ncbi:MAG TPA: PEGA domain-containing protein, partial [Vicinamibacterales bacterium]|nr:PEGA domain-containing protein [Vicinamibacterales bacterium]
VTPGPVTPPPGSGPGTALTAGATTTSPAPPVASAPAAPPPAATPSPSRLDVTSDPAGATVTVNGTRRGVTPLSLPLPPGSYDVAVSNDSSTTRRRIEIRTGVASSMVASFSTAQASAGYLAIATPIELQILEDGNLIGTTNAARVMLPAGRHSLQLVNRSLGFEAILPVNIPAGKSIGASVSLPNGTAFLNALPWANVSVDGRSLGTTPLANIELPIGAHEVVWTHPQFGERKQSITVHVKTPVRLVLDWSK